MLIFQLLKRDYDNLQNNIIPDTGEDSQKFIGHMENIASGSVRIYKEEYDFMKPLINYFGNAVILMLE